MTATTEPVVGRDGEVLPLHELERLWPLAGWYAVTPVAGGKNEHLRLETGEGVHYLRRSYRSKRREDLAGQLRLMRLLRSRGFPAPEVVPVSTGEDHAQLAGRLWTVTRGIAGGRFDDRSAVHLRALGTVLARYHQVVADQPVAPGEPPLLAELRARLAGPDVDRALRERAAGVVDRLTALLPDLPRIIVHGGARRGSLVFDGDRIAGVLDFDSAHPDVRVLDLAVASHDVGKVYTRLGDEDHKVALDLDRIALLLDAYGAQVRPTAAEVEALPLLLEAKRLKRGLGRRVRAQDGEALSENDHLKIRLEDSRLQWLDRHRDALGAVCSRVLA